MQRKWGYLFAGLATVLMVGAIIVCAANLPDSVAEDGVNRKGSLRADTPNPALPDVSSDVAENGENMDPGTGDEPASGTESGTAGGGLPGTEPDGEAEADGGAEPDGEAEPVDDYDYSMPVPQAEAVSEDYFDDAVFIGDSRTEGLILYTDLANATAYTDKGLTVETVFTKPVIKRDGKKISVIDALRETEFGKVYIMFGINETGWTYDYVFIEKYGKLIDEIREINPEAGIYVQEIIPVTRKTSDTHSYVKNSKISEYNELIREMAQEKKIYYIDVGNAVVDEDGCLPENAAVDGIHLKKTYCELWLDYLKTHTVS